MAKPDFDPDAFLAEEESFDPDAFLGEETPEVSSTRTFIPDETPEEEDRRTTKEAAFGIRGGSIEFSPPSTAEQAFLGGFVSEASARQIERVPQVAKELEELKSGSLMAEASPVAFGVGQFLGFVAGIPGAVFKGVSNLSRATRFAKWLNKLTPKTGMAKLGKAALESGRFATEVGAGVAPLAAVKPGATPESFFEETATSTLVGGALAVAGKSALVTMRTISPRFAKIIDNLDQSAKIKAQGPKEVIGKAAGEAELLIQEARQGLASKTKGLTQAVDDPIVQVAQALDDSLLQIEENLTALSQQKLKQARISLMETGKKVTESIQGTRTLVNQRYKQGFDQVVKSVGKEPIPTGDLADSLTVTMQERGLVLSAKGKLKPNLDTPFVRDNVGTVKTLIKKIDMLKKGNMNFEQLNNFKQTVGELADFSSQASAETVNFRKIWGETSDLLESVAPEVEGVNQMKLVNTLYKESRKVIDETTRGLGSTPDLVARTFESLATGGRQVGKKVGFEATLEDFGRLSEKGQKAVKKSLDQASEVTKILNLDTQDVNKTRALFKNLLSKGDAVSRSRVKQMKGLLGEIEQIDKARDLLIMQEGLPQINMRELATSEGADMARQWAKSFAPKTLPNINKLIRHSRRMVKLDKVMPQMDREIETLLRKDLSQSEARAMKMLTVIEPKLKPIFDKANLAKIIESEQVTLERMSSLSGLVRAIFTIPEKTAIVFKQLGLTVPPKEATQMYRNLLVLMTRPEEEQEVLDVGE